MKQPSTRQGYDFRRRTSYGMYMEWPVEKEKRATKSPNFGVIFHLGFPHVIIHGHVGVDKAGVIGGCLRENDAVSLPKCSTF